MESQFGDIGQHLPLLYMFDVSQPRVKIPGSLESHLIRRFSQT